MKYKHFIWREDLFVNTVSPKNYQRIIPYLYFIVNNPIIAIS